MTESNEKIIENLKLEISRHNFKSGEIILALAEITETKTETINFLKHFFHKNLIKTIPTDFTLSKIMREEAIRSEKYGFRTKPNYTSCDFEFSERDKNTIVYSYLQLFDKPEFYSTSAKIYQANLDLEDFWETGGFIAIDKKSIGILWINDLYDRF